ncbi:unnamed protein product [Pleuronectes platessa]|uniref:Uncharacterized protein n=1 Tax=Pleuronectes platessa TaxID=8262 RepID=A0A9N7UYM5_PLEPL|nr:unnamed protein product [Pleuronectes platessa]
MEGEGGRRKTPTGSHHGATLGVEKPPDASTPLGVDWTAETEDGLCERGVVLVFRLFVVFLTCLRRGARRTGDRLFSSRC